MGQAMQLDQRAMKSAPTPAIKLPRRLPTKAREWKTYRTRFLVKAKQLSSNLSFVDPLGRQHSGRKGDYLVESSDGVISIAPRQIFEDIYVAIAQEDNDAYVHAGAEAYDGRKSPQPCRERRDPGSGVRVV
jgi:hypothetical protein